MAAALLRSLGALGVTLGLLLAALWLVRRFHLAPGQPAFRPGAPRRLELVERLALDNQRSLLLVRRDGHEHLIALAPGTIQMLEQGLVPDRVDRRAAATRERAARARADEQRARAESLRRQLLARRRRLVRRARSAAHRVTTRLMTRLSAPRADFAALLARTTGRP